MYTLENEKVATLLRVGIRGFIHANSDITSYVCVDYKISELITIRSQRLYRTRARELLQEVFRIYDL